MTPEHPEIIERIQREADEITGRKDPEYPELTYELDEDELSSIP
jgi:hypothetical protein